MELTTPDDFYAWHAGFIQSLEDETYFEECLSQFNDFVIPIATSSTLRTLMIEVLPFFFFPLLRMTSLGEGVWNERRTIMNDATLSWLGDNPHNFQITKQGYFRHHLLF
jgi:hypothetical protein